jgi:hypothetical protein
VAPQKVTTVAKNLWATANGDNNPNALMMKQPPGLPFDYRDAKTVTTC